MYKDKLCVLKIYITISKIQRGISNIIYGWKNIFIIWNSSKWNYLKNVIIMIFFHSLLVLKLFEIIKGKKFSNFEKILISLFYNRVF